MITIKGCIHTEDIPELKEGMDKATIAFVYNPDHLRLWPGEYVPATVTIDEAWRLPQKELKKADELKARLKRLRVILKEEGI